MTSVYCSDHFFHCDLPHSLKSKLIQFSFWTHQIYACPRIFALAIFSLWKALLQDFHIGWLPLTIQKSAQISPLQKESQRTGQQTCKPPCLCTWDQSPHIRSYHRAFPPSLPYRVPCFYELIATGCPPVSLPVVHNHPEMAVNMPRIIRLSTYQAIRGHLWGMTLLTRDVSWHTDPYNHPLVTFPKKILMENPVQFRKLLFQRCSWLGCKALRSRMSFNLDAQAQFGYKGISL